MHKRFSNSFEIFFLLFQTTHVFCFRPNRTSIFFLELVFCVDKDGKKNISRTDSATDEAMWRLCSDLSIFMIIVVVRCLPIFIFVCFHKPALEIEWRHSFDTKKRKMKEEWKMKRGREKRRKKINDSAFHRTSRWIYIRFHRIDNDAIHSMNECDPRCLRSAFPWNERNDWARGIEIDAIKMERSKKARHKQKCWVECAARVSRKDFVVDVDIAFYLLKWMRIILVDATAPFRRNASKNIHAKGYGTAMGTRDAITQRHAKWISPGIFT